jgi:hypothetical protein
VYGDLEPNLARALLRGAWLAAAWDTIDPREEKVVRTLGEKLAFSPEEVGAARADAIARVDARRTAGLAAVDYVRYMHSDRIPGAGVSLAAAVGTLMLPRRYREEALAQLGHGATVTLAGRHTHLSAGDRAAVLGIAWATALHDDPSLSRLVLLRLRHDQVAKDLAEDATRSRHPLSDWVDDALKNATGAPLPQGRGER